MKSAPPVVLALAGHDPSGGAGIQADIETIHAQGCHATTAITCLTVQDSSEVWRVQPVEAGFFLEQARCVTRDLPPASIKIGLVPDEAVAAAIDELLEALPGVPVVLDPVLHAGGGRPLSAVAWLHPLLARATLVTPNRREARLLAGEEEMSEAARALLAAGAGGVLVTGADEAEGAEVVNSLFGRLEPQSPPSPACGGGRMLERDHEMIQWRWPRLPGSYHGSGCTLASAIAARLALGEPLEEAVARGQAFTQAALEAAIGPGKGQHIPWR